MSEEIDHGRFDAHLGRRHPDLHQGPGQVARHEGLLEDRRVPDGLDAHIGAVAARRGLDRLHRVALPGVDRVCGAERPGQLELARVEVDSDDGGRPGQLRPGDGGTPHTAATEDRHRVAHPDVPGEHRGTETGHHAAPQEAGRLGPCRWVDLGALSRGHQRLVGERADAECGRELGAVEQGHLLRGVVGREAVPGSSAPAGATLPAHGTPVEDDEVARRHRRDVGSDRLDDPRGLVAQQEGEVVVDPALPVVQVGMAHPAGLDPHHGLSRPRVRHHDRLQRDRLALGPGHHSAHVLCHAGSSPGIVVGPMSRSDHVELIRRASTDPTSGPEWYRLSLEALLFER